jgi:predicted RNA-binding protein associated with RNAse of E/G family
VIDQDELEATLKARVISRAQYEGAWREAERVAATWKTAHSPSGAI